MQRKRREFQEDLNQRKMRNCRLFWIIAEPWSNGFLSKDKYDLILQEAVFVGSAHDITEKVIRALNSGSASGFQQAVPVSQIVKDLGGELIGRMIQLVSRIALDCPE